MSDWAVGLSTGCCWRSSIFDCLEDIRNSGFSRIEICSHVGHLDYHDMDQVKRAAARIDALGLEPYSFHAPFADHIDITSLDEHVRNAGAQELMQAVDAAAVLKVKYFVVHPGPEKTPAPANEKFHRLENAVTVLDRAIAHCRKEGVGLVLENMLPHLFAGNVRDLLWVLGALNSAHIGVCLDTGHAHLSEDPGKVVQKLSGHLWMVHASDNHGKYDEHLAPGEGDIDWRNLLVQLSRMHFAGTIILELAELGDRAATLQSARRGRAYIRNLSHGLRMQI